MKTGVTQDNHALLKLSNQPLEGVIRHSGGGTRPRHHQAVLVEQETEFPANNPAVVRHAFAADLLWAPAFTDGMDQLDAIRVNDPKDRRGGEEAPCPVVMGPEEAKEPGALGEVGKPTADSHASTSDRRAGCPRL